MNLIVVTILAPLFAALVILVLRRIPELVALLGIAAALISSFVLLATVSNTGTVELAFAGLPNLPLLLIATPLTALFATMVTLIASLVLVYAVGYMQHDSEKPRFFAILLLFISAMLTLVLAGDWLLLLSAWELIGLSSYLLIGFWYHKKGVKAAANRAFLVTRSADLGLYIAIFILIDSSGTSNISASLATGGGTATIAGILLLVAAMGKSAQTPLHDWLQGAMAGPTPVSALLHSATLVAAGAILLIRSASMFTPDTLFVIALVGGITAVVTGLIALAETDLKRLLAASTSSQYGLMLLAIGAGVPLAALLHLLAHAAIKSSLFLGAGVFQHSRDTTLLEQLRGVGRDHRAIFIGFTLSALALAGIPPLSGFFSKDAIIAATLNSQYPILLVTFALLGTLLTGSYMARIIRLLWQKNSTNTNSVPNRIGRIGGIGWMGFGVAGLVGLAVILAVAFPSIEVFVASQWSATANDTSIGWLVPAILGLTAALVGLSLGWFIPVSVLLGPVRRWANSGFSIAGGFDSIMVGPADAVARRCQQLEVFLYQAILAIGRFGLKVGSLLRRIDEQAIDGLIFSLVRYTVHLGSQAARLQSGFIHKELAISTIIIAVIFVLISLILLVYS